MHVTVTNHNDLIIAPERRYSKRLYRHGEKTFHAALLNADVILTD